jgi:hypothetical protein
VPAPIALGRLHRHGEGAALPEDPAVMLPILKAADVTLCGGWFSGTLVTIGDLRPTRTASRR